jgi:hypothetical protein
VRQVICRAAAIQLPGRGLKLGSVGSFLKLETRPRRVVNLAFLSAEVALVPIGFGVHISEARPQKAE